MKRVIIAFLTGLLIFMVIISWVITSFISKLPKFGNMTAPKPGVSVSLVGFTRHPFAANLGTGTVTDLKVDTAGQRVLAAGVNGGGTWSFSGKSTSFTPLPGGICRVQLVPMGAAGTGYLFRGTWASTAQLFDPTGKEVWSAPANGGVDDAVAADFKHLGHPQILVGYNGSNGLTLFDANGSTLWHENDSNVWHVAPFHDPTTGVLELVHSNAMGRVTIRDTNGNVVSQNSMPSYFNNFSVAHWPTPTSADLILVQAGGGYQLINATGVVVKTLTSTNPVFKAFGPLGNMGLGNARGVPFRLKGQPGYCFAVVYTSEIGLTNSGIVSIFDASGKLIYEEVLPEMCSAVAAMTGPGGAGPDTLLVGGTNHIWAY